MPKIQINDFELYYSESGSGDPLMMIMGLGANSEWWDETSIERLSEHFKVIKMDNRGTGRSDKSNEAFTINNLAEDVAKLLDKINISRANILGLSMGGMIAQEIAINFPEKVSNLVLCSTFCGGPKSKFPSTEVVDILSKSRKGRSIEEIVDDFAQLLYTRDFIEDNPEIMQIKKANMSKYPISNDVYKKQGKAIFSHNACKKLKSIKSPTLIMHGREDVLIPPENAEIMHDLIPNSKLVIIDNTAHELFSQQTAQVLSKIIEFLE